VQLSLSASGSATFCSLQHKADRETTARTRLFPHYGTGISRYIVVQLLLIIFVLLLPVSAQQSPVRDLAARPCKILGQEAPAKEKPAKREQKNAQQAETDSGKACLEVHSSSLEAQEHLQAFVREQRWPTGDEDISEVLWAFRMELSKQQLLSYTKLDAATERVNWRGGKASAVIQTTELSDGYTRTVVSAYFEGFGESEDKFAMKRASWKLTSNGRLEATLIGALQAHVRAKH
jgi:hypothetical protein